MPVTASKHSPTSRLPTRWKRINLLPATTGPLKPSPIDFSQRMGGPCSGQEANRPVSRETPLRSGPKNCGQSSAHRERNSPQRHKKHKEKASIEYRTRNAEFRVGTSILIIRYSFV